MPSNTQLRHASQWIGFLALSAILFVQPVQAAEAPASNATPKRMTNEEFQGFLGSSRKAQDFVADDANLNLTPTELAIRQEVREFYGSLEPGQDPSPLEVLEGATGNEWKTSVPVNLKNPKNPVKSQDLFFKKMSGEYQISQVQEKDFENQVQRKIGFSPGTMKVKDSNDKEKTKAHFRGDPKYDLVQVLDELTKFHKGKLPEGARPFQKEFSGPDGTKRWKASLEFKRDGQKINQNCYFEKIDNNIRLLYVIEKDATYNDIGYSILRYDSFGELVDVETKKGRLEGKSLE